MHNDDENVYFPKKYYICLNTIVAHCEIQEN